MVREWSLYGDLPLGTERGQGGDGAGFPHLPRLASTFSMPSETFTKVHSNKRKNTLAKVMSYCANLQ